jgi:rubrerythrin
MRWTLDDINWDAFDLTKVDPELLKAVKAAALVEFNSPDYVSYLKGVFRDEPDLFDEFEQWGREEAQHGRALAAWARRADPGFDFERRFARFRSMQGIETEAVESIRGSRPGEMIARCVVESGTSSFYTAIKDYTEEPCLKQIVTYMAADEFAHYRCFFEIFRRFEDREPLSVLARLRIALARVREADDFELAAAYFCANGGEDDLRTAEQFSMRRWADAYQRRALLVYREQHIHRLIAMVLKAAGLAPHGWLGENICWIAWRGWQYRLGQLERVAA